MIRRWLRRLWPFLGPHRPLRRPSFEAAPGMADEQKRQYDDLRARGKSVLKGKYPEPRRAEIIKLERYR